ncbi:MAG TPA: tRNA (adenosine(37)-N6)-threonylcarbamoyltransferase complex dimerization subunit type 1 TsaB [Bacteroidetes bacterium]|nr:tRNA (adenosine(37)-N6)-threonylcarbamoyltransferase complex dimerization subunit type 1 TsaB [Bacteroidota bacterium]
MIVLGIETSTAVCGVGLFIENGAEIDRSLVESHIHSEKLLTLLQEVVAGEQLSLNDIDAVAVSIGPGSFTGLRIGLSTAKGLCYAIGKPLLAVPTFEAIAEATRQANPTAGRVLILVDAKKDEYYCGRYEDEESGSVDVRSLTEVLPVSDSWPNVVIVTDRVDIVKSAAGDAALVLDVHQFCRASIVARLGYRKALGKEFADVGTLEPMYLKDFIVQRAGRS